MSGNIIAMRSTPSGWVRVGSTRNSGVAPDGIGVRTYAPCGNDPAVITPFQIGSAAKFANVLERHYVCSALNDQNFQAQYWSADHMTTYTHTSGVCFEFWHDSATKGGELFRTS